MYGQIAAGIAIPFIGTSLGAAGVYFMKKDLSDHVQRFLTGFASGVMTAASIWSLLIPAIEDAEGMGHLAFVPAAVGFWIGILFLLMIDHLTPHLHRYADAPEGPHSHLKNNTLMMLAVTIHNIPEGMAVGVVYAGMLYGHSGITASAAMALSLGIAIQNFPEGAIISMPMYAGNNSKNRSFIFGVLSGAVEPAGAVLMVLFSSFV
ncbi:MAG: ZIP family metal transporter, partial [Candidatus Weimeria sp.]